MALDAIPHPRADCWQEGLDISRDRPCVNGWADLNPAMSMARADVRRMPGATAATNPRGS
jgi:hypothetical protein